jgi:tRNA-2-methylthio-N6-dimethylallyladenosine synthase
MTEKPGTMNHSRFHIHTFGCQMNESDSEQIAGILTSSGAEPSENPENSDIILVNTCAVREKSEEKLYSLLGRLMSLKKRNKNIILGVAGCVAQLHRSKLLAKFPGIDVILGPDNYWKIPDLLALHQKEKIIATEWSKVWHDIPNRTAIRKSRVSAYVTIMEGCNNFCSYCIVPFTRGREKSRPMPQILDEIRMLALNGYKEIQLLGQNVNSYHDPVSGTDFSRLLKAVNKISEIEWLRFVTSHPKNFKAETAAAMAESQKVCHQLHLPVQSGSSSVLKRMNRGYTIDRYLEVIETLRNLMPDISLSTDIIVGFPGETDKEFEETLYLLENVRFTNIFSFRYSSRPKTAASQLEDDVPFETKKKRLIAVQTLQKKLQIEMNQFSVGKRYKVLFTGKSKKNPSIFSGRNEAYQVVNFISEKNPEDRFVEVEITSSGPYSLRGHDLN